MAHSDLIPVFDDQNFDTNIAKGVVLVDFYADWCGPCRMLTPVVEQLAKEMQGRIVIAKIDTDQSLNTAAKYEVTSIPTLLLFKNGELVNRVVGLRDIEALRAIVNQVL